MSTSRSSVCLAAVLVLAVSAPAQAGEEDAKTMFAAGRAFRAQGKCEEAILQFRRALEVYPEGLGSLRNIAECEEQTGKYAAARRDWWDLRRAVLQTNEPKYNGWDKDAEAAYNRLASKVARVTIKLKGEQLDRVRISMDGKPVDPRLVGVELERDLGGHTIEAFYEGAAPISERIELAEGEKEEVLMNIPAPPKEGRPIPSNSVAPADSGAGMRTAGVIALGLGGAAAIGTVVAVIMRQSALADIENNCADWSDGDPQCNTTDKTIADEAKSRGETASLLVNVFGGVAIVGLGVGTGLPDRGLQGRPAGIGNDQGDTEEERLIGITPSYGGALARARVAF